MPDLGAIFTIAKVSPKPGPLEGYLPIIFPVLVNPGKGGVFSTQTWYRGVYLPDHQGFWVA